MALAIEAEAVATEDYASLAGARIVLGRVLLVRSGAEPEAAEARFHGALVAAESAADSAAAVEALTMLAHTVGAVDGRFHEADQFVDQARAKLGHLGSSGDAAAALDYEVGMLRLREYRNGDALVAFRSALEQREALLGSDHPKVAKVRV